MPSTRELTQWTSEFAHSSDPLSTDYATINIPTMPPEAVASSSETVLDDSDLKFSVVKSEAKYEATPTWRELSQAPKLEATASSPRPVHMNLHYSPAAGDVPV